MDLITERLKLIPLRIEDIESSLNNLSNFYNEKHLKSKEKVLSDALYQVYKIKLKNMIADPENYLFYTYWLIIKKDNNMIVGRIGFKNIADDKGETELGYGINPNFRSKGYMTEALKKMINWGFRQQLRPIKTIIAKTDKENISSQKVLQKVGFEYKCISGNLLCWKLNNKANNY